MGNTRPSQRMQAGAIPEAAQSPKRDTPERAKKNV